MNIKEYIKELSIVILGILIAFWVSNLGEVYNARSTQKQVLKTILKELNDNSQIINRTIHSLDTLEITYSDIKNETIASDSVTINYIGLSLRSIGYETAKYTGILKDIDYDLTSRIVENYEAQNSLRETEKLVIDQLMFVVKNRTENGDEIDYLLLQIRNLKNNLSSFEKIQKKLLEELSEKVGS